MRNAQPLFNRNGKEAACIKRYLFSRKGRSSKSRAVKRSDNSSNPLFSILLLLFIPLFAVSVFVVVYFLIAEAEEKTAFTDLAERSSLALQAEELNGLFGIVSTVPKPQQIEPNPTPAHTEMEDTLTEPEYTEYAALYAENSDFVGWLHVENTKIDYPVMYTPDNPEYYLRRAFDKSSSQSGTPFVSKDSTVDSDFYIIYGHNMKNGTMFGTLDSYADKAFWQENPEIFFTTMTEQREYEVFAALETRVLYQDEAGYRYYFQVGDLTQEAFGELISWLRENALYDTGITPLYGEQILVLSTCSYHEDNGRFIVAARRTDRAE